MNKMEALKRRKWESKKWLDEATTEFREYENTKKGIKLAHAGEKLWNAFILYLDGSRKERTSYKDIKDVSMKDPFAKNIFNDAYWLHIFYYRGYSDDLRIEEEKFRNVRDKLKGVI